MIASEIYRAVKNYTELTFRLSDNDLDREWSWNDYDEGVRFSFFRVYEELRQLAARMGNARSRTNQPLTTAQHTLAQYHAAYRDLQAVLIGVSDEDAAHPPAEGEWSAREALAHMIAAERTFFAINLDALQRVRSGESGPLEMNDEAWETFWEGDNFDEIKEEALTSKMLSYHDNLHWRIMTELVDISEKELHTPVVFWESTPMPLEFRLHRFDAHLRQHTIQIEKTLKAIGLPFTEAKRLLRLIYAALADVENQAIGLEDFGGLEQAKVVTLINDYSNEVNEILSV